MSTGTGLPLRQTEHPRAIRPGRQFARLLSAATYRVRVHGREHVPASGPVILAINHRNILDGPVVYGACPRPARFLVKAEMFSGALGVVLRQVGQIPIRRGTPDRGALRTCMSWLRRGEVLGVFPEGTRGQGDFGQVRHGLTWLALRAQAPVVPVVCLGIAESLDGRKLPKLRSPVDVVFGEAFEVGAYGDRASRRVLAEAAEDVRVRLVEHHEAAAKLAGRQLGD
ncbi:MAG: 1-acyl-sn-glycerol-3-phosphate acyltransferase [Streptosporangiales bacterium]|nr:1-acyl-sn-glycerol-3-phosphate acyltransferase [Streptosporangiales bacterium]